MPQNYTDLHWRGILLRSGIHGVSQKMRSLTGKTIVFLLRLKMFVLQLMQKSMFI